VFILSFIVVPYFQLIKTFHLFFFYYLFIFLLFYYSFIISFSFFYFICERFLINAGFDFGSPYMNNQHQICILIFTFIWLNGFLERCLILFTNVFISNKYT
jgi:hypothetical protein